MSSQAKESTGSFVSSSSRVGSPLGAVQPQGMMEYHHHMQNDNTSSSSFMDEFEDAVATSSSPTNTASSPTPMPRYSPQFNRFSRKISFRKPKGKFKRSVSEDKTATSSFAAVMGKKKTSLVNAYKKSTSIGSAPQPPSSPGPSFPTNVHFNMKQQSPFIRRCMSIDPDSILDKINDHNEVLSTDDEERL